MTETVQLPVIEEKRFENNRRDTWWIKPVLQGAYLVLFGLYAMWAVIIDSNFGYTSAGDTHFNTPFYTEVSWFPGGGLSLGPLLIWAPIGFRATCYYARKVYYRALFWDPPGCAIAEAKANEGEYKGENKLPYLLNNFHRYFFYLAFILAIFHAGEFINLIFEGGLTTTNGAIATLILGADAFFLGLYVLSCHSCKHAVGGGMDRVSGSGFRRFKFKSWKFVKRLNINHHAYFWLSLTTILLADAYIRFVLARGLFI